jgi:hypothetical protein
MNGVGIGFFLGGILSITVAGCAFLFWPRHMRLFALRYDFSPYKKGFLAFRYLLGSCPLFQAVLALLLPLSDEKACILLITGVVIFCQYLLLLKDRLFLEKKNFLARCTREQVQHIDRKMIRTGLPNFYGTTISLAMFLRLGNWWTSQQLSNMLSLLPLVCVALYLTMAGVEVLLVSWARRQLRQLGR